jgi:sugar/nucleoside kinase (ribokinase family)
MGVRQMVAVHFPRGGIVAHSDGRVISRPSASVPASEIAGANGAGDAFAAGLLYAIHEGWSAEEALELAHAVAAASLREISTTAAIEPWADCLSLARQWGWRDPLDLGTAGSPLANIA